MQKIRYGLFVLLILLCSAHSAPAQVSIAIGVPHVSIGINLPLYPELVPVPGYPVYYAPRLQANYFFYDGMYWVFQHDNWYASSWYNGPWWIVEPNFVPLFILRIPVSYYRLPPPYFRHWHSHAPPRWGEHWGRSWEQRRHGWDRWERRSAPSRAPLPVYQRRYTGDRYPSSVDQQRSLRNRNYRYQPRDRVVRQHIQPRVEQRRPAPAQREGRERVEPRGPRQQEIQRQTQPPQNAPSGRRSEPQHRRDESIDRSAPVVRPAPQERGPGSQDQRQRPGAVQQERQERQEQRAPRAQGQEQRSQQRRESQQPDRGRGQGEHRGEGRGEGRGGGRD
ncbi:MAG: hypothetical protein A2075_13095 [Geobacteraceae bacterium GWC2_58_44]|nr:MAG: hypothetical protein A2075_13095 [Geobacteraceae bacterium GWC2_58_44]HBG06448.1 hypothetical protein [Geobacter sp.]